MYGKTQSFIFLNFEMTTATQMNAFILSHVFNAAEMSQFHIHSQIIINDQKYSLSFHG